MTLSVDGQGVVTDATQHCQCTTPAFGFTSEGLTGQPLNKVILMRGPMEPFMSAWVEATRAPPFQSESQLVSVRHANGSMRFGIAYFNADYELVGQGRDAKPVGEPSLSIPLYCLDFLPVVLDMHDDTSIRHVYGSIRLLSGQSGEELTTRPGASVLPQLFRQAGRSADALLLLPGQRRAASNKHKHVVGSEQYSEGMSGPLGVKVTCQAARIQGTKDTVMMLLEPTGPSPGPVKAPVARAFVPGLDDVHVQRAGRKGKEGAAAEGGEAEGAAAEGAAGQDAKQDGAAEQGEDGAGQVAAAAVESGHDAAGAEGATAGAAGAEGGADEKGKDNGLMRGAAEGREGEGSQEGKAPAGEAGTEPPRVSRYTAGGRLSGSSHGDSDEEGGGGERQGFAYQRMKDWVDHDGSTHKQSMGPAELFTEPASLTGAAISRLQESLLQAGRADSAGESCTQAGIAQWGALPLVWALSWPPCLPARAPLACAAHNLVPGCSRIPVLLPSPRRRQPRRPRQRPADGPGCPRLRPWCCPCLCPRLCSRGRPHAPGVGCSERRGGARRGAAGQAGQGRQHMRAAQADSHGVRHPPGCKARPRGRRR